MFRKAIALGTAICLMCSSLVIPSRGWAAEEAAEQAAEEKEQAPEVVRTIVGRGSEGWDIVDIRKVEGTVVVQEIEKTLPFSDRFNSCRMRS